MANPTTNFGWVMPTSTDLVTDLPADFEVFGQAVDTAFQYLKGGTTGQILSKTSNTDLAFTWVSANPGDITGVTAGVGISGGGTSGDVTVTNSMATAIDAKGDLIAGTGADAFSRLAVGTNGQLLTADSTAATGLAWTTVASGGSLTLAQVATGSLTGSSISITGLSSYDNLVVVVNAFQYGSSGERLYLRVNGSTSTVYDQYGYSQRGSSTYVYSELSNNVFVANYNQGTGTTNNNRAVFILENCKNAGFTRVRNLTGVGTGTGDCLDSFEGVFRNNSAVSSISLLTLGANWTSGTYTIYGA